MTHRTAILLTAAFALSSTIAVAQATDTPYQIKYAANLNQGDSLITFTNSGATSTTTSPQNGTLCANFYAIAPSVIPASINPVVSCCSCQVTAGAVLNMSVKTDLLRNVVPLLTSATVKMLATVVPGGGCNANTVGTGGNVLATGMLVWGTTLHSVPDNGGTAPAFGVSETPFSNATLSAAELTSLTAQCAVKTGGTPVTCNSCRVGAR